jgi:hypothetical protein
MESDRRKHERKNCTIIIDYQPMGEETTSLSKHASSVNVSANGMCIYSPYRENPDDLLLLSLPYITPNPGIIAAKVKYSIQTPYAGYYHGLLVLPLFQERFSVVDSVRPETEQLEIPCSPDETEFIRSISKRSIPEAPIVVGICKFFNDLNPRVTETITSFDELCGYLKKEIEKRTKRGR